MPIMTTVAGIGDAPYDERERRDLVFAESYLVDDDGTLVKTYAVHLGVTMNAPWPRGMPVLVKGSPRRFAIERCRSMRISKPEVFRQQGETLISDLDEGITRHEESSETVRVDDTDDLNHAGEIDDELNRGAAAIGSAKRQGHRGHQDCWQDQQQDHAHIRQERLDMVCCGRTRGRAATGRVVGVVRRRLRLCDHDQESEDIRSPVGVDGCTAGRATRIGSHFHASIHQA